MTQSPAVEQSLADRSVYLFWNYSISSTSRVFISDMMIRVLYEPAGPDFPQPWCLVELFTPRLSTVKVDVKYCYSDVIGFALSLLLLVIGVDDNTKWCEALETWFLIGRGKRGPAGSLTAAGGKRHKDPLLEFLPHRMITVAPAGLRSY